ncbi:uncharacterized LOC657951 precursor [Tribolium castaneum]|uniref:Neuropeptide-like 4 n=1 Tax=Tribolium castaneum TaxID=7070 RepID=D6WG14_TRICA|nr:uncharacterized LOC657951 precursor [Tribolium castaneum]EFA00226.1 hypothetical protein TcasGA2_TC003053 [Tribolium castaneum]
MFKLLLVVFAALLALAVAAPGPQPQPQIYSAVVPGVYSAGWVSPYAYSGVAYV